MLDMLRRALEEECGVDPETVHENAHLLNDLDIDSLDLLNASFRLEKDCGVKLPVQRWLADEYGDQDSGESHFLVASLCRFLSREAAGQ